MNKPWLFNAFVCAGCVAISVGDGNPYQIVVWTAATVACLFIARMANDTPS